MRQWFVVAILLLAACQDAAPEYAGMTTEEAFPDSRAPDLIAAALNGERERANAIAEECGCADATGKQGVTPLLWVLGAGNHEAIRTMIRAGANPARATPQGDSALSLAAAGDDPELLRVLLTEGGDANARGPDGMPLLHLAAMHHRAENVELLLEHGAEVNAQTETGGATAAEVAVAQGEMELAYRLLDRGTTANLHGLADALRHRKVPPDSERGRWKEKLIAALDERGVEVER